MLCWSCQNKNRAGAGCKAQNSANCLLAGGICGAPEKQSIRIPKGQAPAGQHGWTVESPGNAASVVPLGLEGAGLHPLGTAAEDEEIFSGEAAILILELLAVTGL